MTVPASVRFVIKRHAHRPYLRLYVTDKDGNPFDFSSATGVIFLMYDSDGVEKVNAAATIVSPATGGILQYTWQGTDTDTAGEFKAEFDVSYAGELLTLPLDGVIEVKIYEDVNDG